MYSITPVQYTSSGTGLAYIIAAFGIVLTVVSLISRSSGDESESGMFILFIFGLFAGLAVLFFFVSSSLDINDDNYDTIATDSSSPLSIKRSYVTARGVSQAVGRPVGTASAVGYQTADASFRNDSRPVSYLADDGYIRQGTVRLDRSGSEWSVTLLAIDGKAVLRPSHEIGASSALIAAGDDDRKSIMHMSDNGIKGDKNDSSIPNTATMQASSGSTVRITRGNGTLSMDDGRNPVRPVRLTILDGKAYAISAGAHFGKPITVG